MIKSLLKDQEKAVFSLLHLLVHTPNGNADLHSIPWIKCLSTSLEAVSILVKQVRLPIFSLLDSLENTAAMRKHKL